MKNNPQRILEWGWLVASALGMFATTHSILKNGLRNSFLLLVITLFCFFMFFLRRSIRKKSKSE